MYIQMRGENREGDGCIISRHRENKGHEERERREGDVYT